MERLRVALCLEMKCSTEIWLITARIDSLENLHFSFVSLFDLLQKYLPPLSTMLALDIETPRKRECTNNHRSNAHRRKGNQWANGHHCRNDGKPLAYLSPHGVSVCFHFFRVKFAEKHLCAYAGGIFCNVILAC